MTGLCLVHKHPIPAENTNEDKVGAAFMQQCLTFIDLDTAATFDPCQFSEDTMKYVYPKAW